MHGGLSKEGLQQLESKIDGLLKGRDPKSADLETTLKDLIGKYAYEVEYHNIMHKQNAYKNKYGVNTPPGYRASLSLANFMWNGVPAKAQSGAAAPVADGKQHVVTPESMETFIKSFEALLQGKPSIKNAKQVFQYDPNIDPKLESLLKLVP